MPKADTPKKILDLAERLVQTRGYNGFSYADIAGPLGLTKASLHYHFPAKAALGSRLIGRYEKNFLAALEEIDRSVKGARQKLRRYAAIYAGVLRPWQILIPRGVGHGYKILATEPGLLVYATDRFYDPSDEGRIAYDHPGINYDWSTQHK